MMKIAQTFLLLFVLSIVFLPWLASTSNTSPQSNVSAASVTYFNVSATFSTRHIVSAACNTSHHDVSPIYNITSYLVSTTSNTPSHNVSANCHTPAHSVSPIFYYNSHHISATSNTFSHNVSATANPASNNDSANSDTSHNIPAVFAFGDSTVDAGNNNDMITIFTGNHLPYGCDLPDHVPPGRFSNGKIGTDYLVQMLGIKDFLPAYFDPTVSFPDLVTGVSFGSGGSGLDNDTAKTANVMNLDIELELFKECFTKIRGYVGDERANHILDKALFLVSIGSNDMIFNAYMCMDKMTSRFGSISNYQDFLLQNLHLFVQKLYGVGARRVVVAGLPPIGCLPLTVTCNNFLPMEPVIHERKCKDLRNMHAQTFNMKLQFHINSLQTTLHDAKIAYLDIYNPIFDMMKNPNKYGYVEVLQGCCGSGQVEMGPVCNIADPMCPDPTKYLFWDAVHLTEKGNWFVADNGIKNVLPYFNN